MPVLVDVATDGVRSALARERVREIVRATLRSARVTDAMISVTFVSGGRIAALNRRHLGMTGPTDVIAFVFARVRPDAPVVGDVYVAPAVARANAREQGIGIREELTRLVVHGTLHVVGHDHPEGTGRMRSAMWRAQERLVSRLTRGAA
jgi:probable rRNA maturation factor